MDLGRVGVWWSGSWRVNGRSSMDVAAELENLGYTALWSSGGFEPGLAPGFERLLATTTRMTVLSGIVSIWLTPPGGARSRCLGPRCQLSGSFRSGTWS